MKQYSRVRADGVTEYYDSEAELQRAQGGPRDSLISNLGQFVVGASTSFNWLFAICGGPLLMAAALIFFSIRPELADWPKWGRALAAVLVGIAGGYVIGRIGNALVILFVLLLAGALVYGVGSSVWRFV